MFSDPELSVYFTVGCRRFAQVVYVHTYKQKIYLFSLLYHIQKLFKKGANLKGKNVMSIVAMLRISNGLPADLSLHMRSTDLHVYESNEDIWRVKLYFSNQDNTIFVFFKNWQERFKNQPAGQCLAKKCKKKLEMISSNLAVTLGAKKNDNKSRREKRKTKYFLANWA